jgi:hypothetical protein
MSHALTGNYWQARRSSAICLIAAELSAHGGSKTYVGAVTTDVSAFAKAIGRKPNLAIRYFNWARNRRPGSSSSQRRRGLFSA